jgi:AcrR family transcriptional regulator
MVTSSKPEARQRIVAGAADMISRRGLTATSIREMAKHSGAPLGSTYHYFPDGKQQLATEAVRFTGETVSRSLHKALQAGPGAGLEAFLAWWRAIVVDTGFRAGCPVLAVAIEEPPDGDIPPALAAAAQVFTDWESLLAASLREHGADATDAVEVATLIVAAVEGTVAMCRAKHSTEPLDRTAGQLQRIIQATIRPPEARPTGP